MGTNLALVQGAYAAFGQGDIGGVLAALSDDVDWSSPGTLPHGGQFRGPADVGRFFEGLGAVWQPLALEVELVSEVGDDQVVGVVRAEGTLTTGGRGAYGAAHVFTVRDGKIVRFREYTDLDKPLG